MRQVEQGQVVAALRAVGLQMGDGVLVHSALQFFGKPVGGLGMYYQAFNQVLNLEGDEPLAAVGTLAVPTFNFAFARGEAYDPQHTPSVGMGAFCEYVRRLPQARRTPHPMQSLAVVGLHADDLASRDTPSAFDPGSAFERMLELDFKLVLLGADIQAVSMLHYSEQRAGVPYRYWKEFTGAYRGVNGWEQRTYRMFVRDLNIDVQLELYPVQEMLQERGLWRSTALNYGQIACCRLQDFVAAVDQFLARDPWSLVVNPPGRGARER